MLGGGSKLVGVGSKKSNDGAKKSKDVPSSTPKTDTVNHTATVNQKNNDGNLALHIAARTGQLKTVQKFIRAGADVNQKSENGKTALMGAAEKGHTSGVGQLLAAEADANPKKVLCEAKDDTKKEQGRSSSVSKGSVSQVESPNKGPSKKKKNQKKGLEQTKGPKSLGARFDSTESVLIIDPTNEQYKIVPRKEFDGDDEKYKCLFDYYADSIYWVNWLQDGELMPLSLTFDKQLDDPGISLQNNPFSVLISTDQIQTVAYMPSPEIIKALYDHLNLTEILPDDNSKSAGTDELDHRDKLICVWELISTLSHKKSISLPTEMMINKGDYDKQLGALKTCLEQLKESDQDAVTIETIQTIQTIQTKLGEIDQLLDNMYTNHTKYKKKLQDNAGYCLEFLKDSKYTESSDTEAIVNKIDPESETAIIELLANDYLLDLLGLLFDREYEQSGYDHIEHLQTNAVARSLVCKCFGWEDTDDEAFVDKCLEIVSETRIAEFDFIVSADEKSVNFEVKSWKLLNHDKSHNNVKIGLFIGRIKKQLERQKKQYANTHCVFISNQTDDYGIEQERNALQFVAEQCDLTPCFLGIDCINNEETFKKIVNDTLSTQPKLFVMYQRDIHSVIHSNTDDKGFNSVTKPKKMPNNNPKKRGETAEQLMRELLKKHKITYTWGFVLSTQSQSPSSQSAGAGYQTSG